jgi:hypothetical protein
MTPAFPRIGDIRAELAYDTACHDNVSKKRMAAYVVVTK